MEQPEPLHPANAEAIAEFAEETGIETLSASVFIRDTILETVQAKMLAQAGPQAS